MQKFLLLGIVVMFAAVCMNGTCYAQQRTDSITISTYYPSPYGVYKIMRLYPDASPNTGDNCVGSAGEMAYDETNNVPIFCNGLIWEAFGGSRLVVKSGTILPKTPGYDPCLPPNDISSWGFNPEKAYFNPAFSSGVVPTVTLTVVEPDNCGSTSCRITSVTNTYFEFDCWVSTSAPGGASRHGAQAINWVAMATQ